MTERREWPNGAKEARDRSAELAAKIVNSLNPVIDPDGLHHHGSR